MCLCRLVSEYLMKRVKLTNEGCSRKRRLTLTVFLHRGLLALIVAVSLLASCFFVVHWGFNVPNVSAVTSSPSLGVYWDAACTKSVSSISWGNVSVGSEKDATVYIKNLNASALTLSMNMSELSPSAAYLKIYLCWDYGGQQLRSGRVVKVTLRLFVSPYVSGVSSFSFNINIGVGLGKSPDISGDRIVNLKDLAYFTNAWLSGAGGWNYDYRCDLNNDGTINLTDLSVLTAHWLSSG